MAAFAQPGYVVAIIKDGKILRESNQDGKRTAVVPFGSEYQIRLMNKTSRRAYAKIYIDGMEAHTGKLILQPNSKTDIERFVLDGDMNKGDRFKFVEAGHSDVQDPTAKENGEIKVVFEGESTWFDNLANIAYATNSHDPIGTLYAAAPAAPTFKSRGMSEACVNSAAGATVGGSYSNQTFQQANVHFNTFAPVEICVQLRGPVQEPVVAYKPTYGSERKPYVVTNQSGQMVVDVNGTVIGGMDAVEITGTHLVLKIPMSQVQIGWFK